RDPLTRLPGRSSRAVRRRLRRPDDAASALHRGVARTLELGAVAGRDARGAWTGRPVRPAAPLARGARGHRLVARRAVDLRAEAAARAEDARAHRRGPAPLRWAGGGAVPDAADARALAGRTAADHHGSEPRRARDRRAV